MFLNGFNLGGGEGVVEKDVVVAKNAFLCIINNEI